MWYPLLQLLMYGADDWVQRRKLLEDSEGEKTSGWFCCETDYGANTRLNSWERLLFVGFSLSCVGSKSYKGVSFNTDTRTLHCTSLNGNLRAILVKTPLIDQTCSVQAFDGEECLSWLWLRYTTQKGRVLEGIQLMSYPNLSWNILIFRIIVKASGLGKHVMSRVTGTKSAVTRMWKE